MSSKNVYDQQPPNPLYFSITRPEILITASENNKRLVPIDFCLNKTILDTLESDENSHYLLEGHEDDPLDEKQSNCAEIFVYVAIYFIEY